LIKTRIRKIAFLGRTLIPEIRSRSNLLSFRAMIYATSYAMLKAPKRRSQHTALHYRNLGNHLKLLEHYATRLHGISDMDPSSMSDTMKASVGSYVEFFYSMNPIEIDRYIKSLVAERHSVKRECNLLYIPAIMSEVHEDPNFVKDRLFRHLYAVPFKTLHRASRDGIRVLMMENRMAIKSIKYDAIHDFSKSVSAMDARISEILSGKINPPSDEQMKTSFIESAVKISEETDINIAEIISSKVSTNAHTMQEMQRLIRKARHNVVSL
jgi:hypothetical protein